MPPSLTGLSVILVEPQFPGNIGMVCRAMKNMGLSRLRLVAGCDHLHPEAFKFAVSARDLLEQAELFDSLADALADISVSVATTRRSGKYRQELLSPPQAAQALLQAPGSAALVFGREDHGLSTADLSLCTLQATIPSSSEYGSLNLAQAALIFCYELFGAATAETGSLRRTPAPSGELEPLFTHMEQTLLRIGHLNPQNPGHIMRSLRRIFFRSGLDSREVAILRGMLSQIDWAAGDFNDRKKTT
ncbi:RNA methyltransferase [Trichlorobacter lovleyi]|uniref:tRNA (cytidine/uridine-2'-O-)-methyltransferase TrmJ n=1 Tax=Trichlorobacter lovleyi (strain ATCC BAA-1151 / DSM 17278 / SZ) TaxID=398767 RepID=B3E7A0_TRIL1|nr:RNA methyltransferase [Trichlorobacter lovleyi]ACD94980.1 RNA methyltransferase, TrmH family, group 1 [Trichlorobacter lovleyi SZ]